MTQKPREHLELSCTCRNDVGTSIDPSATASPYFSGNPENSTSQCCNLEMNPCGLPITKFASTSCLSQTYISQGRIPRYLFLLQNMTHISQKFLLWCDKDCGYFFDDPIVKEGIVLQFVSGNFQKIRKNLLMPKMVEIFGKPEKFHQLVL